MSAPASLDKDPIIPLFFKYYLPTITGLLSITIHQIIDGIILGQYVGKEGIAAVGLFGPVLTIFISIVLTLVIGGGILISKSIGAKNSSHAQRIFQFITTVLIIIGCVVGLSSFIVAEPISLFLVGEEDVVLLRSTYDYMFWGFLWLPFFFMRFLWGNCVTNDNAPKVSRNASLLAVFLNIILDVLLIIVFPLGTAGASIATGIAVFASMIYLLVYLRKGKGVLSLKGFKFTLRLKEWKELFNYGIPSFVSEVAFSIGLLMINKSLIPFGALAISAFGLVNHLSFIFLRFLTAAMVSFLPIISFNIGAGLPKRVSEMLKFSLLFTFILGVVVSIIGFTFADLMVSIFSGNETEDFNKIAIKAIGLYFILFIAAGPNYILSAYFQSIGKSSMSIITNLLKSLVFVGFFLFLLPGHLEMGVDGIWLSRSFAEIAGLILIGLFTLYRRQEYYSHESIMLKSKKNSSEL